jgi:hypothetical protein
MPNFSEMRRQDGNKTAGVVNTAVLLGIPHELKKNYVAMACTLSLVYRQQFSAVAIDNRVRWMWLDCAFPV